jgi:phosphate/sulfate permease
MTAGHYLERAGRHALWAAVHLSAFIACIAWVAAAVSHGSPLGAAAALTGAVVFGILATSAARDAARYFSTHEQRSRVDRLIQQHPAGTGSEP